MPSYAIAPAERDPQRFNTAIRQMQQGRVDYTGTVTLATGAATTVVHAPTAGVGNQVFLEAQTANAAVERASGNLFTPLVAIKGQFTIHHTNSATTGRTFSWMVLG